MIWNNGIITDKLYRHKTRPHFVFITVLGVTKRVPISCVVSVCGVRFVTRYCFLVADPIGTERPLMYRVDVLCALLVLLLVMCRHHILTPDFLNSPPPTIVH